MKTQKQINSLHPLFFVVTIILFSILSCTKDEGLEEQLKIAEEETAKITETLSFLNSFIQEDEIPTPQPLGENETERDEQDKSLECSIETYKASPGYDEMLALDPSSDVIYPGAMLKGESIPTGEYIGINGGRAPITLSISLENLVGKPSVDILDPKLSTVRAGVKDLLSQGISGATAAELVYETSEVYSEEHLNLALGANYRSANKSVSASFDFSSSEYKHRYVIKYLQIYYTIDLDLPTNNNPGVLFTKLPELNSTSPVIVSSVKYGRMVLYTVESNYSKTEIESAFNASFKSVDGSIDGSYEKILKGSSIKGIVIGGSGKDAAKIVDGPKGVYEYITNGGDFSKDSPAAPLAYTLRYIQKDFPIARVVLTSEYPIRTCYEAYQKFRVELYGFKCVDNDGEGGRVEIYGSMSGKVYQNNKKVKEVSWEAKESNYIGVDENKFYKIDKWIEVELYKPDLGKDYVVLKAEFSEDDGKYGDDYFGKVEKTILLKDVDAKKDNYIRVNLQDDYDSDMRAYFYAYRVNY